MDKKKEIKKDKTLSNLPPLNRYPSRKIWEDTCWQKILESKKLLEPIITSYERHNLTMRAVVVDRIKLGKRNKEIAEELLLSKQTINSIKKAIEDNSYISYRERGKKERKKKIYSHTINLNKKTPFRRYRKTKYGRVYLP